jgi:hypothetical protein
VNFKGGKGMLRRKVEEKIGPLTEEEWVDTCQAANKDIRANRISFKRSTSMRYTLYVLTTAALLMQISQKKEKPLCRAALTKIS